MKSVLISIQPKWCEFIANGKKTIEVRKTKPKLATPFKCFIYCTLQRSNEFFQSLKNWYGEYEALSKWNREKWGLKKGKVIGEFMCDEIVEILPDNEIYGIYDISDDEVIASCLVNGDLWDYGKGTTLYGWNISNLVIYDKPRELGEFKRFCEGVSGKVGCRGCEYYYEENDESQGHFEMCGCDNLRPITRPPQSWMFCESEVQG